MKKFVAIAAVALIAFSCSNDEWNDETRKKFMDKCTESLSEDVCKCSLEKVEKKYKPSDMDKGEDKEIVNGIADAMKECMGL